jgi:Domain of unknown function (DUF3597)
MTNTSIVDAPNSRSDNEWYRWIVQLSPPRRTFRRFVRCIVAQKPLGATIMSIFGNIMSAIFGRGAKADASPGSPAPTSTSSPSIAPSASAQPSGKAVDVEAVVSQLASQKKEKLNWRTSIVDLMKVLDLDSSLAARKELAKELHYTGDMNDSAAMNIWLHKQVMQKLAENGGKVPDDLKN